MRIILALHLRVTWHLPRHTDTQTITQPNQQPNIAHSTIPPTHARSVLREAASNHPKESVLKARLHLTATAPMEGLMNNADLSAFVTHGVKIGEGLLRKCTWQLHGVMNT